MSLVLWLSLLSNTGDLSCAVEIAEQSLRQRPAAEWQIQEYEAWRRETVELASKKNWPIPDFKEASDLVEALQSSNDSIRRESLAGESPEERLRELERKNFIQRWPDKDVPGFEAYHAVGTGTGFYLPKSEGRKDLEFTPGLHIGVALALPGTGSNYSKAESVSTAALRMASTKKYKSGRPSGGNFVPEFGDTRKKPTAPIQPGFRLFTVLVDFPVIGLGEQAHGSARTPEGTLAAVRRIHLLLSKVFPQTHAPGQSQMIETPFYMIGRSQGGLVAQAYANRYGEDEGLYGVFAINPSPTDLNLLQHSARLHEDLEDTNGNLGEVVAGQGEILLHGPSWITYRMMTPLFDLSGHSKARAVVIRSTQDTSYDQHGQGRRHSYGKYIEEWRTAHRADRRDFVLEHYRVVETRIRYPKKKGDKTEQMNERIALTIVSEDEVWEEAERQNEMAKEAVRHKVHRKYWDDVVYDPTYRPVVPSSDYAHDLLYAGSVEAGTDAILKTGLMIIGQQIRETYPQEISSPE